MNLLIPCLGIIGSIVIIVGFLAFFRYINYKETITLAEKGLSRPEKKTGKGLLCWGMLLTLLGLVLSIGLYIIGFNSPTSYPLHLGPWMLGGLIPLFLGIGLVLHYFLTDRE